MKKQPTEHDDKVNPLHTPKVGDTVRFEVAADAMYPRWNYSQDLGEGGCYALGTVTKVTSDSFNLYDGPKGPGETYRFPLPGHPAYAPGRPGWPTVVDDEDVKPTREFVEHDDAKMTDDKANPLHVPEVGDTVRYEASAVDIGPRWNYNLDLGTIGRFDLGTVIEVTKDSYVLEGPGGAYWFPLPGHPGYADGRPGWPSVVIDEVVKPPREFVKHDDGKPRLDLLPPIALCEVGKVLGFGAKKYAPEAWRSVDDRRRYLAAALRHLTEWASGNDVDDDSGLPHLAHAACSVLFLLEADVLGLGEDTRPR